MRRIFLCSLIFASVLIVGLKPCCSQELITRPCPELIRIAERYQEDLKTINTILGSAIEAGSIHRIKNYKLRKDATKQQLESVLEAIEARGCVKR
jgi:hypothetical protein